MDIVFPYNLLRDQQLYSHHGKIDGGAAETDIPSSVPFYVPAEELNQRVVMSDLYTSAVIDRPPPDRGPNFVVRSIYSRVNVVTDD